MEYEDSEGPGDAYEVKRSVSRKKIVGAGHHRRSGGLEKSPVKIGSYSISIDKEKAAGQQMIEGLRQNVSRISLSSYRQSEDDGSKDS